MKAKELIKKETDLKAIYEQIESTNNYGCFKIFIPHDRRFSEKSKLELIENGFKVYRGDWDGVMTNVFIIEW